MKKTRLWAAITCLSAVLMPYAVAQNFPTKPIRIIVPFPAGGTSDILTRLIGAKMAENWKQQVLPDNRPGANGNIGADMVARAAPDGHTLVLMDVGGLAISPSVFPKMPFDILKDFAPVTLVSYSPHILTTHPSVPVKNVRELIALAKSQPGKLNYATGLGGAPHMAGLMFAHRTGVKWLYVPTKGGAQSVLSVITGESDVLFNGMLATLPHAQSGRLKLLPCPVPGVSRNCRTRRRWLKPRDWKDSKPAPGRVCSPRRKPRRRLSPGCRPRLCASSICRISAKSS